MRMSVTILAGLAAGCAVAEPVGRSGPATAAVAAAMAGRVAGDPVSCVDQTRLRGNRLIAGAMLFEARSGVVYVNEGIGGCQALAHGRAIRTSTPAGRLCRGDIVTAFDPVSGAEFGGCSLGDFVPYRRAD